MTHDIGIVAGAPQVQLSVRCARAAAVTNRSVHVVTRNRVKDLFMAFFLSGSSQPISSERTFSDRRAWRRCLVLSSPHDAAAREAIGHRRFRTWRWYSSVQASKSLNRLESVSHE